MIKFQKFCELLKLDIKYLLRSKTILAVLLFTLGCQSIAMYVAHKAQINISKSIQDVPFAGSMFQFTLGQALFIAIFIQVFCGAFLTIVYGTWGVPHLHRYPRADLTFVLPVSKWLYPVAYGTCFLIPLMLQYAVMFGVFGFQFGWDKVFSESVPWDQAALGAGVQIVAFEMALFFFSFFSILIGQVPTLFFGTLLFTVLQSMGALMRTSFWKETSPQMESLSRAETLYNLFPPMGELTFALRAIFSREGWEVKGLIPWLLWLAIFVVGFRWCLRLPLKPRAAE